MYVLPVPASASITLTPCPLPVTASTARACSSVKEWALAVDHVRSHGAVHDGRVIARALPTAACDQTPLRTRPNPTVVISPPRCRI